MIIRYARKQDSPQVKRLWAAAFGDEEPYFSWYFREIFRPQRTLAVFDGQEMLACLQLAPYTLSLHSQPLPVAYLVGVTTAEAFRHRGIGHRLLHYALAELAASKFQLALLYTDIPAYYAPLGFTQCYTLRQLIFSADDGELPAGWQDYPFTTTSIRHLNNIYQKMCSEFDGFLLRNENNWRSFLGEHFSEGGGILATDHSYLLWTKDKEILRLRELGFLDRKSLRHSLEFAQRFAAARGCSHLQWLAPQNIPLIRQRSETAFPWVMARCLSQSENMDPETIAAETRRMLGAPDKKLWINEMT